MAADSACGGLHGVDRVTGSDVARRAGVSQASVSLVLNGRAQTHGLSRATHDRVMVAARELGYVPNHAARSLRRRRTNVVTLLTSELANPYFTDVAAGAAAAAAARGYAADVISAATEAAGTEALRRLRAGGTSDGVIMHGGSRQVRDEVAGLREQGMRCVLVQDAGPAGGMACVRVDLQHGAALATRHLIGLGHRRIAHLTDRRLSAGERNDRLAGYRAALAAAGLGFDPALVVPGENSLQGGAEALRALLARPGPRATAVFAFNDQMAVGALHALHGAGLRVPEDMAVIGFDGIELGRYTVPALTTIAHPRRALGQRAAETLLDLLDGREPAAPVLTLPVHLVVRRSCGAASTDTAPPTDIEGGHR